MQTLPLTSKGFTLIEVLISMALLAFISILVYQATTHSFEINNKLSTESNDLMGMAITLQTMDDDISQIFTPSFNEPKAPPISNGDLSPSLFWSTKLRPDGLRRARLLGTKEKLSFVSNNNSRIQRGIPESDFQLIQWEVTQSKTGTYQLKRYADTNAFNYELKDLDSSKGGSYIIVDSLSSAQFSYYRKEGDKWEDNWDSEGTSVKPGARYPEMISLKMEGPDPTNPSKQVEWKGVFRPNLKINTATEEKKSNVLPPQ